MSLFYNHTLLPPLTTASHPHHHLPPPMRGVSKFSLLLATPVSLLHHRRCTSLLRLTRTISISPLFPTPPQSLLLPIKASSKGFHSQTNYSAVDDHFGGSFTPPSSHPLPEWSKLVEAVSALGYLDYSRGFNNPEDEFVSYDGLPEQFVRDAAACLTFARERLDILGLLSRRHIEILVQNGAPFLFKSALDTERRLRSFLGSSGSSYVMESDKAATVDLLKYIVSFASNPTSTGRNNSSNMELTESSVRFLLNELVDMSCRAKDSDVNAPDQYQHSGSYGQTSRFLGPKIEMKRGDWICSKCSFMNFARNLKCLECEGPRPKRQLTGGEWECPQCDFLNYGRNMACLRCDCKRPGEAVLGSPNSISASGYNNGGYANNYSADGSSQNQSISGNSATNLSSPLSRTNSQYGNQRGNNSGYTPFVPLPPDMFAKKNQESTSENGKESGTKISDQVYSTVHDQTSIVDKSVRSEERVQLSDKPSTEAIKHSEEKEQEEKSERWFKRVAELHDVPDLASAVSDKDFPDIMPMRKGENRFVISKKKDRSLTSPAYKRQNPIEQGTNAQFVPFVPFPPDYFAKKDKQQPESKDSTVGPTGETSLENSTFKKSGTETLGMNNMSGNSNLNSNSNPSSNSFGSQTNSSNSWNTSMGPTTSRISNSGGNPSQPQESQNLRNGWTGKSLEGSAVKNSSNGWNTSVGPTSSQISNSGGNPSQPQESQNLQSGWTGKSLEGSSVKNISNGWNTSVGPTSSEISNSEVNPSQPQESQNFRSGWTGKSLEGSAVTEPDPLDMSEEAKAERWFRRVAQIKDISELSQIPDEDFPSIMPMRKGVNRFVVSKRKTPLERRLTSPQYRKNLPVMNSDPRKNENDNN